MVSPGRQDTRKSHGSRHVQHLKRWKDTPSPLVVLSARYLAGYARRPILVQTLLRVTTDGGGQRPQVHLRPWMLQHQSGKSEESSTASQESNKKHPRTDDFNRKFITVRDTRFSNLLSLSNIVIEADIVDQSPRDIITAVGSTTIDSTVFLSLDRSQFHRIATQLGRMDKGRFNEMEVRSFLTQNLIRQDDPPGSRRQRYHLPPTR
jgi:hypothetical protein